MLIFSKPFSGFFLFAIFFLFSPVAHAQDLYRFYSPVFKGHFYTVSVTERDRLFSDSAWRYEGVAYSVQNQEDNVPVYRFWSPQYKRHFFTSSISERDRVIAGDPNWIYEGRAFDVSSEGFPVYRFWSSQFRSHFYTTSVSERNSLIAGDINWRYEGVAWRVSELAATDVALDSVYAGVDRQSVIFEQVDLSDYPTEDLLLTFSVVDDDLEEGASVLDQQVWDLVRGLAPTPEIASQLVEFSAYYEEGAYAGYVQSLGGTLEQWRMQLNYSLLEDMNLFVQTVVHEYAHIMAVQDSQVTTIIDDRNIENTCETYYQPGICYNKQSYLQAFYEFWQADEALLSDNRDYAARVVYYDDHRDMFVSEYATRNLEEDFAETLEYSVFGDISDLGDRAQEKVRRVLAFPKLAQYRRDVRQLIASW